MTSMKTSSTRCPLGHTLFESHNPIRTRGPMQVNVAFLKQTSAARSYPYTVKGSLQDELFTRRGSVYFGVAHLLGYRAPYPRYLYRFADFNAGQYASRNAAFQSALADRLRNTGDPGRHAVGGNRGRHCADWAIASMSATTISTALWRKAKAPDFEHTTVYKRVFALAEHAQKRPAPQAVVPKIKLEGPKLSRTLTTDWYAHRVDGRFQQCVKKSP